MVRIEFSVALCLVLFLGSCEPQGNGIPMKHEKITRNLPTQDREYLLKPLEASMDDIRSIIENDQSLFESDYDVDTNGITGNVRFKLSGRDTVMIIARLNEGLKQEVHKRFWDDQGHLFLLESEIKWSSIDGQIMEKRAYKLYFEEQYSLISSYGKTAFNEADYPASWSSVQMTPEEFRHMLYRVTK